MGGGEKLRRQRDCEGQGCPNLVQQSQKSTRSPQLVMLFHGAAMDTGYAPKYGKMR